MPLIDQIDPAELTGYAREFANGLLEASPLTPLFPDTEVSSVSFSWTVDEALDDVAEYRAFDTETTIGNAGGGEQKIGRLAPLGRKYFFGEEEQLAYSSAGSAKTVQSRVDELAEKAARAIVNRIELLRGEAIVAGALAIDENNFVQTVDFGRDPAQTNAAPAAAWDTLTADPITDLAGWVEDITEAGGVRPDYLGMSSTVFRVLAAFLGTSDYVTTQTGIVSAEAVNNVLGTYDIPPVVLLSQRIGSNRVIPTDRVVLGVAGLSGATVWGTSVSSANPKYRLDGRRPGMVVGAYQSEDSDQKWVRGDALALAVLLNPATTLSARVLTPATTTTSTTTTTTTSG